MFKLSVVNYRCFPGPEPVTLDFRNANVSAIVGPNNSGKSSLLRLLFEVRPFFSKLIDRDSGSNDLIQGKKTGCSVQLGDIEELFSSTGSGDMTAEFEFAPSNQSSLQEQPNCICYTLHRSDRQLSIRLRTEGHEFHLLESANYATRGMRILVDGVPGRTADLTYLIECLRSLRDCVYIGAFRNAINRGADQSYYDLPVGQAFVQAWSVWSAGPGKQGRQDAARLVATLREIFGFRSLEISPAHSSPTLMLNVDGNSHWLQELGSGLAQFLIVLGTLAMKKPDLVLIDEPELNLHPSLQRSFLSAILQYSRRVVFATHSLGLAHCDAEQTISVRRVGQGHSSVQLLGQTPRLPEFLGEMGYAGYRERGFDTVLLVEGVHDVKVVMHYLRLYEKDHKVVIVQLGGTSMITGDREMELRETLRICPRVFAMVDSERTAAGGPAKKEIQDFEATCKAIGIVCKVLDRRATENYFTAAAVKEEFPAAASLGAFDPLEGWHKRDNWRIAQNMTRVDLDGTDLGPFIQAL